MLNFERIAAQGELTLARFEKIPENIGSVVPPENGLLIVGHSETGHHHVVDGGCATLHRASPLRAFLNVHTMTQITHLRGYDTHEPIQLQPGMYEVRTGREFDPFEAKIRASMD